MSCASRDSTALRRVGAVRVPSRPGTSDTDIARSHSIARPRCVVICKRGRRDARPFVQDRAVAPSVRLRADADRARAVDLPWRSNDVGCRSRTWQRGRGEPSPVVARRSGTVVKGRRGKRSRDGTPREAVDHGAPASRARMRRAQRAPRSTFGWGERVPSLEPFSPPPSRPAPARRAFHHAAPLPAPASPPPSTSAPVASRGRLGAQSRSRISESASTFAR